MSFPRFSLSSFVTLFSFQGTIFYIDFKFKQVCVQFAFSSTSSRTSVRKTEKKCEMCVKLFELVEMRRIELLTPCLQGRCSPSWATPPYEQGIRIEIFSFPHLKVHNLSIAPSKLNNDLQVLILIDHRIWVLIQNSGLLRKEVIQPHLPIRLPCYDFTLITTPTFGRALLAVRLRTSGIDGSHGVTGGVYKARERIHRGMLIRDY